MIATVKRELPSELKGTIPADLESLEWIALEFRRMLENCCCDPDAFASELLFREAITNAVIHGCGQDPARSVSVLIRIRRGRVVIAIDDRGPGFDWRSRFYHEADTDDTGGRGLEIYRAYANRIRFNRNGSRLVLVRRFSSERPV